VEQTIWSYNRRLFTTNAVLLGFGLEGVSVGDVVCVLTGCKYPYVLRQVGNKGHYKLIGEYYVPGLMYGEAMEWGWRCRISCSYEDSNLESIPGNLAAFHTWERRQRSNVREPGPTPDLREYSLHICAKARITHAGRTFPSNIEIIVTVH
jgi:hypothetical protein